MTRPNPPQAVISDLGGVVIGIDVERMLAKLAAATGTPAAQVAELIRDSDLHERHESGRLSFEAFRGEIERRLGAVLDPAVFDAAWNSLFDGIVPGMDRLLPELRKHVRLVALSNTNARHAEVWRELYRDVLTNFERVFVSHEMGLVKPRAEIYLRVLEYLRLPAGDAIYIDDRQEHVDGARAVGLRAFVATSSAEVAGELRAMGVPLVIDLERDE